MKKLLLEERPQATKELFSIQQNEAINSSDQNKFLLSYHTTSVRVSSSFFQGSRLWNEIPLETELANLKQFSKEYQNTRNTSFYFLKSSWCWSWVTRCMFMFGMLVFFSLGLRWYTLWKSQKSYGFFDVFRRCGVLVLAWDELTYWSWTYVYYVLVWES